MKIIHKYIIKEILGPLFLGFFLFTFIFLIDKMAELVDLIINKGVSLTNTIKLLIYIMPAFIAITVPMGILIAVLIAFSRLNSDNEIMAMKTNGLNIKSIVMPVIIFGLILSIVMVTFNNYILPRSNMAFKNLYFNVLKERASIVLQEKLFIDEFNDFIFYIEEKENETDKLKNITIYSSEKTNESPYIVVAKYGYLLSDPNEKRVILKLYDGTLHQINYHNPLVYNKIKFNTYDLDLDLKNVLRQHDVTENIKTAREMNFKELGEEIKKYFKNGINTNYLKIEYHKKIAIPFACFAFTFVGISIGTALRTKGKSMSFLISIFIILVYYFLLIFGEILAEKGKITPWLGMWLPNFVIGIIGIILLYFTTKEKINI
ncbi:MAG: LPS export ABC transporter permease LptF [Candidatus Firestonebacteria bacterium]